MQEQFIDDRKRRAWLRFATLAPSLQVFLVVLGFHLGAASLFGIIPTTTPEFFGVSDWRIFSALGTGLPHDHALTSLFDAIIWACVAWVPAILLELVPVPEAEPGVISKDASRITSIDERK